MYCEDTDLCYRLRQAGKALAYVSEAVAIYYHGVSSEGSLRPRMIFAHNSSRYQFFQKHGGLSQALACWCILIAGGILRAVIWTFASIIVGIAKRNLVSRAMGYWNVLFSTLGLPFARSGAR